MGLHTTTRRCIAAASLTALAGAAVLGSAPATGAQEPAPLAPGQHRVAADSQALHLSLLGEELSIGLTDVSSDSVPEGIAHAAGALLSGLGFVGEENAVVSGLVDQVVGDDQPTCSPLALPAGLPVQLAVACGTAAANITSGLAGTLTSAGVADLSISATSLLETTPLAELPVQETVDQVLGGLAPVFEVVNQLGLDAESLVGDLLDGITQGGDLVRVQLGPSSSSTVNEAVSAVAAGRAQGAVITVIDRSLLSLPPVLTIEVGAAAADARTDRATGAAEATITPALVRVTIAQDIATALALPTNVIEVAPGVTQCLGLPAPLDSCISVAGGRVVDTADGGKRAESEGVALRLLTGLPEGGIVLGLAATSAEAAAVPAELTRQEGPAPVAAPPALARTGVESMLPAALALGSAGTAGLALVGASRRRR